MTMHSFDVAAAQRYGILEAVLLQHFRFWISKNKANDTHHYDGTWWTFNSVRAFETLFPYASTKQIRRALDKLVKEGLLITGNYNKSTYDRTRWFALTEAGWGINPTDTICPTGEIHLPSGANGSAPQGEPIPVNNTDKDIIAEIVTYLNDKTGKRYRPNTRSTTSHIRARLREGYTVSDFKAVIDTKTREWLGGEMEKFLRPETLFGTKFEGYLMQSSTAKPVKPTRKSEDEIAREQNLLNELRRQEREAFHEQLGHRG